MNFSEALSLLKKFYKLTRTGWNKQGMWIAYQAPDEDRDMTQPYLYLCVDVDHKIPWTPSQADLIANDWVEIGELE